MAEIVTVSNLIDFIREIQESIHSPPVLLKDTEQVMNVNISDISPAIIERGKEYVAALLSEKRHDKPKKQEHRRFYRGHYSTHYDLVPSAFRGHNWGKEDYYYHEIAVRSPEFFQGKTHLDRLVTMQHYECPTRLLDITSNPLVALFFACMNYGCKKCDASAEGVVYIFDEPSTNVVYADSDRSLMLACLARFSEADKMKMYELASLRIGEAGFEKKGGNGGYKDVLIEKLFHEIAREVPAFKREIKPLDLLKPLFVQPNRTNMRIAKQDGAFILSGLCENVAEAQTKLELCVHKKIHVVNQDGILRELEQLGIHEASLFPELDKVAHYLKTR